MPDLRKRSSRQEIPFNPFTFLKFLDGIQEPPSISWTPEQIGRFRQGLVIVQRYHDNRIFPFSRDDDGVVILAYATNCLGQCFSSLCVCYRIHMDRILYI